MRNKYKFKSMSIILVVSTLFFASCDNKSNVKNTSSNGNTEIKTTVANSTNQEIQIKSDNYAKIVDIKENEDKSGVTLKVELLKGVVDRGVYANYTAPDSSKKFDVEIGGIMDKDEIVSSVKARGKFDLIIFNKKTSDFMVNGILEFQSNNDKNKAITTPIKTALPKKSN